MLIQLQLPPLSAKAITSAHPHSRTSTNASPSYILYIGTHTIED